MKGLDLFDPQKYNENNDFSIPIIIFLITLIFIMLLV